MGKLAKISGREALTRRRFLQQSALLAASGATLGIARGQEEPPPPPPAFHPWMKFPVESRDRLAVASYPFRRFIESPYNFARDRKEAGMDLKGFAAMVAQRFKLHGIEPLNHHFVSTESMHLRGLCADFEKAGVHVVNIPCDIHESLYDPDEAKRQRAIDEAKKWVNVAATLGSPSVRVHIADARGGPDLGRAVESLTQVASYGTRRNVVVNLENDDLVSEDAFFLVKVIDTVGSPYLRALPDFCNSMLTGVAEFNYDALTLMFRHAYNISHMKDSEADDSGKVYTTDVARTFAIAKEARYRGYFSMEWDRPGDPYQGTQRLIEETLKYLTT